MSQIILYKSYIRIIRWKFKNIARELSDEYVPTFLYVMVNASFKTLIPRLHSNLKLMVI